MPLPVLGCCGGGGHSSRGVALVRLIRWRLEDGLMFWNGGWGWSDAARGIFSPGAVREGSGRAADKPLLLLSLPRFFYFRPGPPDREDWQGPRSSHCYSRRLLSP
ncbi:hypothetical protein DPEC_G00361240 [Dallia pectoralis]|uniref:Uncharacterized protein n=1 Tax=Dallia pectoralis TaxID=75939 RepID=A0ACC2F120_DALPE|nr:hypothetical protein DPEC_G00361240 [Dallia pectoralis]